MICRPVGARSAVSAPRRSLSPAWARQGAQKCRGDTLRFCRGPASAAGRNIGTADDTGRYEGGYYGYGQAGTGYGYAAAGPTDSGGPGASGAAAAAAPPPDTAAWPGADTGYDNGAANTSGSSGWQQGDPQQGATGWADGAEWGAYEAPGEWGARGQTFVAGGGAEWDPATGAATAGDPGPGAGPYGPDDQAWQSDRAAAAGPTSSGFGPGSYGGFDQDSFRGPWGAGSGGRAAAPPPPPGASGPSSWGAAGPGAAAGFGSTAAGGPPPPLLPSDITLITPRDAELVLPVLPTNDQARHYQPKSVPERVVQVLGSIGVSAALSKSALLAAPALLYPIWGPWIRAGARNAELYLRQFRSLGLWRAQVLSVEVQVMPYAYMRAAASGAPYSPADSVSVTVGDPWPGGARAQLRFPYVPGCEALVAGESAEMLVLCRDAAFTSFKVVREVYFPQSGLWLADYPFVNRDVFLDISLAVERGRQSAAAGNDGFGSGGFGSSPFGNGFAAAGPPPPPAWGSAQPYDVDASPVGGGDFGSADAAQQQQNGNGGDVLYASYRPVEPPSGDDEPSAATAAGSGYSSNGGYGTPYSAAAASGYDTPPEGAAAAGGEVSASGYWINEEGYAVPWDQAPGSSSSNGSPGASTGQSSEVPGNGNGAGSTEGWPPSGSGFSGGSQPDGSAGRWAAAGPQSAGWRS